MFSCSAGFFRILFIFLLFSSVQTRAQGYICAIGGGSENYNSWSDAPYRWIVEKSDSGKILVLSVNDESNWIPDYFVSLGASQAQNLKINSRTLADQQSVYDQLISAKAVFIKGGDQWNYINYWKGTKTEAGIRYIFDNGGVVAGTSAGLAILGDVDFTGRYGSAVSRSSLMNPFISAINLEDNFLNLVPDVLFDSHFIERGRFGRLIAMLFNYYHATGRNILGVGVDDRTAVCIDQNGIGTVMGSGAAAVFRKDDRTEYIRSGNSYTINNLLCDQLAHGWQYDFVNRRVHSVPPTAKQVDTSRVAEFPLSGIWLSGSNNIQSQTGTALADFLSEVQPSKIGVIYNQGYQSSIAPLTAALEAGGYAYYTFPLNSASVSLQAYADSINGSSAFIILGDSLTVMSRIADTSAPAGRAFMNKTRAGNTPVYMIGNSGKTAGSFFIDRTEVYAYMSYRGLMTSNTGLGLFPDLIFQPLIFDNADYYENRTSALLWGMMLHRKRTGIYLDNSDYIRINPNGGTITSNGPMPVMIVDARNTTLVDSSVFVAGAGYKTRQVVAMNNLRYFISTLNKTYSLASNNILLNSEEKPDNPSAQWSFAIENNYPNPFNAMTSIRFTALRESFIEISVFNAVGAKVKNLSRDIFPAGQYTLHWDGTDAEGMVMPTGVYFCRISSPGQSQTIKLLLLK